MKRRVVITGWGLVTSLSNDVDDCWQRVLNGESGIHNIETFKNDDIKVNIVTVGIPAASWGKRKTRS